MNDQAPPDKRVELLEEQPTTVQLCGRAAGIILAGLTYPLLHFARIKSPNRRRGRRPSPS